MEWPCNEGLFPSFAKSDNITIIDVLQLKFFHEHFNLPLSKIAFEQYCEVSMILQALPEEGELDQWPYIWGNSTYSVSKVYNHLLAQEYVHRAFRWI
jgi:hypothetical protein